MDSIYTHSEVKIEWGTVSTHPLDLTKLDLI